MAYHFDFSQRLGAILHEVFDFAGVDAHNAQQQVAGDAKGERDRWVHDGV